jgi:hypothetical protein
MYFHFPFDVIFFQASLYFLIDSLVVLNCIYILLRGRIFIMQCSVNNEKMPTDRL